MVNYDSLDRTFAALADPTRRAVVVRLARHDATVGELAAPFRMSLPAVSKHLSVLEKAGLISRERRGRNQVCRLRADNLAVATAWLERHRDFWTTQLTALADHVTPPEEST
ncbi:MAG: ArsR/SmtB family transcription factor [Jiangellaceae bacterium]